MTRKKGYFIVIEGIDGTGKSSQLCLLAEHLESRKYDVLCTREPSDGPYGRRIRQNFSNREELGLEAELKLFIQDRRQHVQDVIIPALSAGRVVICDRYFYSTAAYQGAAGLDPADIMERNAFAPRPDLVLLLVLKPKAAVRRISEVRGDTLNDFEQEDQLHKVAAIFDGFTDPCIRRIEASAGIDEIQQRIRSLVDTRLPARNSL